MTSFDLPTPPGEGAEPAEKIAFLQATILALDGILESFDTCFTAPESHDLLIGHACSMVEAVMRTLRTLRRLIEMEG